MDLKRVKSRIPKPKNSLAKFAPLHLSKVSSAVAASTAQNTRGRSLGVPPSASSGALFSRASPLLARLHHGKRVSVFLFPLPLSLSLSLSPFSAACPSSFPLIGLAAVTAHLTNNRFSALIDAWVAVAIHSLRTRRRGGVWREKEGERQQEIQQGLRRKRMISERIFSIMFRGRGSFYRCIEPGFYFKRLI